MSLLVFREGEVPEEYKLIRNNDIYFIEHSFILDTDECKNTIKFVDQAVRVNDMLFYGREGAEFGGLYKECLSTGSKTVLNIINNPSICFSLIECGNNARNCAFALKHGIIEWDGSLLYDDDFLHSIDLIYDGIRFTNMDEYAIYMQENKVARK